MIAEIIIFAGFIVGLENAYAEKKPVYILLGGLLGLVLALIYLGILSLI